MTRVNERLIQCGLHSNDCVVLGSVGCSKLQSFNLKQVISAEVCKNKVCGLIFEGVAAERTTQNFEPNSKMRFLCLAGAFGNVDVSLHCFYCKILLNSCYYRNSKCRLVGFRESLRSCADYVEAPIVNQLESDGTATFYFIHGQHEAVPPEGFELFFGGPPFFRWMEESKHPEAVDGLEKIRDFPAGASPEDTLRLFYPLESSPDLAATAAQALEYLEGIIREHGPFEAIIGYSEGALVAGTFIMKEQELREKSDYNNTFKLAMFFGGWPPLKADLTGMMLADETDLQMPVATCHVSKCFPARYLNRSFFQCRKIERAGFRQKAIS